MKTAQRKYDIVLYGATGFVGHQTVAYLAEHGAGVDWAIAGRSQAKLQALLRDLKLKAPIIVADAQDSQALMAMAAQTRVVLSTAGPFALYGSPLVAACVHNKTHYVDITGETPWVRAMIDAHHAQAAAQGTRIVPGCGFDSVPSDIGAWGGEVLQGGLNVVVLTQCRPTSAPMWWRKKCYAATANRA
jgi:short subunit dehydrogenase-like uncharacterized protein